MIENKDMADGITNKTTTTLMISMLMIRTSDDDSDEEVYEEDVPSKKRQRLFRGSTAIIKENGKKVTAISTGKPAPAAWVQRAYSMLDELEELTDVDGNNVAAVFMKLPSRKLYADYYKIIKHVVLLDQMRKQLDSKMLLTWDDFIGEAKQMITNADTYNEQGSWVIKCADLIDKRMNEFIDQWE
ncbi:hypothetical protein PICMEDRAFT_65706 [Pichia membranifaciens NRRL Y-2026]|uniref:Bromo domain-containing protein n=1 Tax=Pichia membranifaciens NRRL Y-2026 TaxID=763406 RepID=A0A1E3NDS4_9ASCO|nr:hypothetical protein PICMEDRAFT_65706 [Pichia membranifaciens NRRL Y-2026]ODQ44281.1 hypothetical protein PICMEDRAFT_65706 [Pichia membranifaciens NRRL Y-2026]